MVLFQNNKGNFPRSDPDQIDHGADSVRFLYDAHIEEYNIIYNTILTRMTMEERTENYLFLIISAILSLLPVSVTAIEPLHKFSANYPVMFIFLAITSLIFPIKLLQQNIFVTNLSNYLRFVLSPKLNAVLESIPEPSATTQGVIAWEESRLPYGLRGVFRYENYISQTVFASKIPITGMTAFFRYLFVCIPSVIFFSFFLFQKKGSIFWQGWTIIEKIASAVFALIIITLGSLKSRRV